MERRRSTNRNEKGYLLLSIMLLITIMLIMLAAEAPRIQQQIKRAKEQELVNRGEQYAIAVRKYVHKFGRYPTSLEQLEDTNHLRFLRKRYTDPMTGKANWKLIHQGEAEIKIPQNNNPGLPGSSNNPGLKGSTSQGGTQPPSTSPSGFSQSPSGITPTIQGPQQGGGSSLGSLNTSNVGNGQQLGGGGIIGVASVSKESGIKEFNDTSEYDHWLFVYDQRLEGSAATFGGSADAGIAIASPSATGAGGQAPSGSATPAPDSAPGTTPGTGPVPTPTPNP